MDLDTYLVEISGGEIIARLHFELITSESGLGSLLLVFIRRIFHLEPSFFNYVVESGYFLFSWII